MATFASLLVERSKAVIYEAGLAIATGLGISTTSWAAGDPTRSLYHFLAAELGTVLEPMLAGFVRSGFLDYAEGDWLTLLAKQLFNYDRVAATYATGAIRLENTGGGLYTIVAGDLTFQNATTGKTYRNTSGGTLAASDGVTPTILDITFEADEPGSESSADGGSGFTLVTTMLGVSVTVSTDATGLDEESDASVREQCRAKLAMLSPNGPRDAYNFVVKSHDLTGEQTITRARTISDSTTGDVTVYVANIDGPVAGASVTAAQTAVEQYCAPCCITPSVISVTGVTVPVTYEAWLYESVGETTSDIEDAIEDALGDIFAARPIGGDIIAPAASGKLYQSLIVAAIKAVYPDHTFRVSVTAPAGDTSLTISQVAVLGTVTGTIHIEANP